MANQNILITKIRAKKGKLTIIEYKMLVKKSWDDFVIKSHQQALPEFYQIMDNLVPHVVDICELPKSYEVDVKATGVTFVYSGSDNSVFDAVILAEKNLLNSKSPFLITTPKKKRAGDKDKAVKGLLSKDATGLLIELQDAAIDYVKGKRSDLELFDEKPKKDKTAPLFAGKTEKAAKAAKPAARRKAK